MTTRISILVIVSPLLLLVSDVHPARGAVVEAWVQRYNNVVSNSWDEFHKVAVDQAGDIIVAGPADDGTHPLDYVKDMVTIKYSGTDGSIVWVKRYHNPRHGIEVRAIAVDGQGNAVVTGSSTVYEFISYTAKYAAADGTLMWEKSVPGASAAVAVDSSNDVVLVGSRSVDGTTISYSAKYAGTDGAVLWEKRDWGGSAVAVDPNDNVVVTGGLQGDYYTVKYAGTNGALLWEQRYNGPANGNDGSAAVAVDASGNVVVTGSSPATGSNADYYTAKYASADGSLLWEKRYNSPENGSDHALAIIMDPTGNVVVAGYSHGIGDYTVKYAGNDGAILWDKRHSDNFRFQGSSPIAVDDSGDLFMTRQSWTNTGPAYYITKYAGTDGRLLWDKFAVQGKASAMVAHRDNLIMVGYFFNSAFHFSIAWPDGYTRKFSGADGTTVWEQRYNTRSDDMDMAVAVAVGADGNVAVTGNSVNSEGHYDFYTAKYAGTTGALLWGRRYNGPGNAADRASALAVDSSGNVIVTGVSWNGTDYDCYTAKYVTANGALLWERHDNALEHGEALPRLALDANGNVVVTRRSPEGYYTAKYAAANGALLWEQRGGGSKVAVDDRGNVVVAAPSSDGYYAAKYAAADGALLWEKFSPPGRDDNGWAVALALDSDGNVVVTGSSDGDHYTIKLAGDDGRLLWDKRHDDSGGFWIQSGAVDREGNVVIAGGSYIAKYAGADGTLIWEKRGPSDNRAIAVDANGNVVVTSLIGAVAWPTNSDYYTAKYAAANGALLWEQRYNGPANHSDWPASLAIGRNGMIVVTGNLNFFGSPHIVGRSDYGTIAYVEDLSPLSIERVSTGVCVRLTGLPGRSYAVERAAAVGGPWSTIATLDAPDNGLIECVDTSRPAGSVFYRARTE